MKIGSFDESDVGGIPWICSIEFRLMAKTLSRLL